MSIRIGIPRALLFYHYLPLWETFFQALGAEVILSPPTSQEILNRGVRLGMADLCLPMKVHLGHVEVLRDGCDFLFLPRLVSFSPDSYMCPKFLGLPDFTRAAVEALPPILEPLINAKVKGKGLQEGFVEMGRSLGSREDRIQEAIGEAKRAQARFEDLLHCGIPPAQAMGLVGCRSPRAVAGGKRGGTDLPPLAVVGHPYNLYDSYLNFGLLDRVREWGYEPLTPERVDEGETGAGMAAPRKAIYWSLARHIVASALHFLASGNLAGMIFVSSVACGPDSFCQDLLQRRLRRSYPVPYLSLTLDEHSSYAGVQTRLEAFLDMVRAREGREGPLGDR
jgi:predicted nucleotide-binding protein (sugar kinase/HSP70/actin superfamily)